MRQYAKCGRGLALGIAAAMGVWSLQAEAITYNVTIVQFETGIETFDFNTQATVGEVTGVVKSSNLPLALTTSSASYLGSAPQSFFTGINGTWTLSDGAGNSLSGDFTNLQRGGNTLGMPLIRGTGGTSITGGVGVFDQASGGGSFEVFARDYYDYDLNTQVYQQVVVNRLQITLPSGPEQTDTRYVGVSVRLGVNDTTTQTGQNIGGPTTDDAPASLPDLTQVRSEYEYGLPVALHNGQSFARNSAGDGLDWAYQFPNGSSIESTNPGEFYWFESYGTAQIVQGHGAYAGYTGESEWQAFESWMLMIAPDKTTYSNVVIDRYTLSAPVPEPETYALMFVGLAVLGLAARRRRTRF
jgi:hypothetical protein